MAAVFNVHGGAQAWVFAEQPDEQENVMKRKMYLLAADNARAKVYEIGQSATQLTVVYEQVNFVGSKRSAALAANARQQPPLPASAESCSPEDEDFAKSLCRMLRSKYHSHEFDGLVVIAPVSFLAAIERNLDRECVAALMGSVASSPAQLKEQDIVGHLQMLGAG